MDVVKRSETGLEKKEYTPSEHYCVFPDPGSQLAFMFLSFLSFFFSQIMVNMILCI